jgi:HAD superfamily hydrolase (TIGR01509 family)
MNDTLRALIFDVDGTLAETERDGHRPAFNEAFAAAGLDWHWSPELYGELLRVGGGKERIRFYLSQYRPDFDATEAMISDLHRAKNYYYAQRVAAGAVPVRPGVRRLLEEARAAGMRLAIATTTSMENVTALLEHCFSPGAEGWFDVIAAGAVVPALKPAPDVYHFTVEALRLEPGECLAIEDSGNGVRSAVAAGVPVLATVSRYTVDDDLTGAVAVLDHLGGPGLPVHVLAGDIGDAGHVDVMVLRQLHRCVG